MSHTVYFVSLGCPKNRVDSEVMLGELGAAGHRLVDDPERAEVVVVNTCGFIEAAREESIDSILEMAQLKSDGRCEKLIVTGCLSQRYPEELRREIPEIDHILGSADFAGVSALLRPDGDGGAVAAPGAGAALPRARRSLPVVMVSETPAYLYDHTAPRLVTGSRHSVYLKIAEGCDRPCGFCIIPRLRGPQRSRTIDSVVEEATRLCAEGARELCLVAQDLTRYGADLPDRPTLAALLRRLARVPGARWIRLHYTYPSAFSDELIDVIAGEEAILPYIDVPLQHIDDRLLRAMRRGHSARVIHRLLDDLRARVEGLVLRTTFIVGHPGETDEAFERLCEFVRASELDRVGVFPYSPEEGSPSAALPDPVPPDVAAARRDHLMEIQRAISRRKLEAMVGAEIEVLVDGLSDESEHLLAGRFYGQAPEIDGTVYLADGAASPGELRRARVTDASDYDLAASLAAPA